MSRPYPNRRRKCKGRPPPHRYKGDGFPIRPTSFQDFGLKTIYDLFLPKLGVHHRRRHFNQLGSSIVLGMGYSERFWVSRWLALLEPFWEDELGWQ